jgi:pilus assembly protein Flp/PilA
MKKIIDFLKNEDGATVPEYALMVALIAAVVIAGAELIGDNSQIKFNAVGTEIGTAGTN